MNSKLLLSGCEVKSIEGADFTDTLFRPLGEKVGGFQAKWGGVWRFLWVDLRFLVVFQWCLMVLIGKFRGGSGFSLALVKVHF